jgi:cell shape-determining protein MreD
MNPAILLLASAIAFGLHTLASRFPGIAVVVDPLLVVAALAALPGRPALAILGGLVTGGLQDAWNATWYGEHTLTHLVIAYAASLIAGRMDLLGPLPAVLVVALATVSDWGLQLALRFLFDREVGQIPGAVWWLMAILANSATGLILHRLVMFRAERDKPR